MPRIVIDEGTGETYEGDQFIAVVAQEKGQVVGLSEIKGLDYEEQLAFLIQGQKLLGELANIINPVPIEGD